MINIDIQPQLREIRASVAEAARELPARVTVQALNRAATSVRAEASREIRNVYTLRASAIGRAITLQRANSSTLTAVLTAKGRRLSLTNFTGVRQTRRGVSVQIKRGQRRVISHAFLATMASGHRGVFMRAYKGVGGGEPRYREKRVRRRGNDLPISEITTLSLPKAFVSERVLGSLVKVSRTRFAIEYERAARFYLSRLR